MRKFFRSPLTRISFGLVMLTVAMLFTSEFLGLLPDTKSAELQSRRVIIESLAVQLSTDLTDQQLHGVKDALRSVVERNTNILSGGIRTHAGGLLVEFGGHKKHWTLQPQDKSTPTQIQVSIFNDQKRWGTVELRFTEINGLGSLPSFNGSFLTVVLFMAVVGFLVYMMFLKRTMRELDPDAVMPERVRKALDTLAEGLIIVDRDGHIVFSNSAFARRIGQTPKQLSGKKSTEFDWKMDSGDSYCEELPWLCVLEEKVISKNVVIKLETEHKDNYTFTVNCSPITGSEKKIRGVLVTFDDITEIEIKNEELRRTLDKLEQSQRDVTRQNQELQVLATRDPLTNTLNRRSFFQGFETLFTEARAEGDELSFIMVDIDCFKSVNDKYGHAVGDKVIKLLANILTEYSRPNDLVGRFGGEEFCVVLPEAGIDVGASIADRMRLAIQEGYGAKFTNALRITSSFGVSTLTNGIRSSSELVDQADKALYVAKESGRNRVICWSSAMEEEDREEMSKLSSDEQAMESVEGRSIVPAVMDEESLQQSQAVVNETPDQGGKVAALYSQNEDLQIQNDKSGTEQVTCLPNRVLLFDRIEQAILRAQRCNTKVAVLIIDVDTLQRVNDTLGLVSGEKFAKSIVARIKRTLRNTDTVTLNAEDELLFSISQLSSREIVVLLTDLTQIEIVTSILQRIFSEQNEPIEVEGNEFYLNTNVGVSVFPLDGEDSLTLIKNASSAKREAMQSIGRNNICFYTDEINQRSKKQNRLESELHRALERGEFVVYYQPKIDLKTGTILGMEALMRWQHPQLGIVPPNDFIPLAEQTGFIEEISQWVIRTVCRQIHFWQEAGYDTVTVAVNLSPVEFRNPDLAQQIIAQIDEFGIPKSTFEVEITESIVMQNMETAVAVLEKLSNAGVCISIDDFGTGYSSLSYLRRFPISKVKIDRSFISSFMQDSNNDAAIVSAIIAMSHTLGIRVVAEGVETEEQLRFLQDLHCDEMQGYLISRPVPREEIDDLLAQSSSIRRMILDYDMNYAGQMGHLGAGSASGMISVLNDFPAKNVEPLINENSREMGN